VPEASRLRGACCRNPKDDWHVPRQLFAARKGDLRFAARAGGTGRGGIGRICPLCPWCPAICSRSGLFVGQERPLGTGGRQGTSTIRRSHAGPARGGDRRRGRARGDRNGSIHVMRTRRARTGCGQGRNGEILRAEGRQPSGRPWGRGYRRRTEATRSACPERTLQSVLPRSPSVYDETNPIGGMRMSRLRPPALAGRGFGGQVSDDHRTRKAYGRAGRCVGVLRNKPNLSEPHGREQDGWA